MPIYEYRCEACGHLHDALQKISDDPLTLCPECEKPSLKRLISAPSFRLKGSGWYETDFKSDKERKRNLVEGAGEKDKKQAGESAKDSASDSSKKDASKEAGKSESKPKNSGSSGDSGASSSSKSSSGKASGEAA